MARTGAGACGQQPDPGKVIAHTGRQQEEAMIRNDCIRVMCVAIIAGWIGGMLSGAVLRSDPVIAQESPAGNAVTAEEFRVVGKDGKVRVVIGTLPDGSAGAA